MKNINFFFYIINFSIDQHEVNDFKGIRRMEDLEKFVDGYIR